MSEKQREWVHVCVQNKAKVRTYDKCAQENTEREIMLKKLEQL